MKIAWAILLLLLALAGCATKAPLVCNTDCDSSAFETLEDACVQGYLDWRPLEATGLGFHKYDGQITDYSAASISNELARLQDFDRKITSIQWTNLTPREDFDRQDLRAGLEREIFTFQQAGTYDRNPMTYAGALDISIYIKRDFAPLDYRVQAIIRILNQASNIMAAGRANLAPNLPRPWVETAIDIGNGSADFLEHDLIEALGPLPNADLKSQFEAADQSAVAQVRQFVKYLQDEKLPHATDAFALGRDNFAKMLRDGEMISLPPEEILALGLDQLHREQQLFATTAAKIDPRKTPVEVFQALQHDHPTAENLLPDVRQDLETIRAFVLAHHLVTIASDVRPSVQETLKFDRAGSFASMDSPGPFESKATEAYYYVTPVESDWTPQQKEEWLGSFNYYTTDVVSTHEVYPGHYVQFLAMNRSTANDLEKIFGSYAFIEGWAHYGEQLMMDQGFAAAAPARGSDSDDIKIAKYQLAQLDESLLRDCRLCVGIKMHCQDMTVDQATQFFEDNCYYGEKPARAEALRGTFDPGYVNYTLGKLMFLKLRRDYQAQEGSAFNLQKFHDALLAHGMPPVPLLRQLLLRDKTLWPASL